MRRGLNVSRAETAAVELGHTFIRKHTAWALIVAFLTTILSLPLASAVLNGLPGRGTVRAAAERFVELRRAFADSPVSGNNMLLAQLRGFEDRLDRGSVLAQSLVPPVQWILTAVMGLGNERAYDGRGGWLYYRPDVEYVTGPGFLDGEVQAARALSGDSWRAPIQPDPVRAIEDFAEELSRRGIHLIVMPTPVKPVIEPEHFARRATAPLQNASFDRFCALLRDAKIEVFDATDALMRSRSRGPQFLRTDSHWTPEAMEVTAGELARRVQSGFARVVEYEMTTVTVRNRGDLAIMLGLPESRNPFTFEEVQLHRVRMPGGAPWEPDRNADVLLLGDSFANVYSQEALGWGVSAGLAEQLSYFLRRPIDRIAINDDGAFATRLELARELARGEDRLAGKCLVIYQFAVRELTSGDWRMVDLAPVRKTVEAPAAAGESVLCSGVVRELTPLPAPGRTPYRDCVISIRLADLQVERGAIADSEILVYAMGMRDAVLTDASRLMPGQRIRVRLVPWERVAPAYEGYQRLELPGDDAFLLPAYWMEAIL
ncbi:MAG: hypothetical protein AB1714_17915 [Acidobacteriota bacterium]